jgi:hypothetical protein
MKGLRRRRDVMGPQRNSVGTFLDFSASNVPSSV